MTNLAPHIEAMQRTAMALEQQGRKLGYYSADCDVLDAAIKAGRSGVAIIFNEDGEPEVFALGGGHAKVSKGNSPDDWTCSYNQAAGNEYELAVSRSHEHSKKHGEPNPMNLADGGTKDGARMSPMHVPSDPAARRAQQQRIADAKATYDAERARNEAIFARMKEQSARIHK
jgi:hypothetical protein